MAIREIPKSYEYSCDSCRTTHMQKYSDGHYTNSTPPNWMTLVRKFSGANVAGEHHLLCQSCAAEVNDRISFVFGQHGTEE